MKKRRFALVAKPNATAAIRKQLRCQNPCERLAAHFQNVRGEDRQDREDQTGVWDRGSIVFRNGIGGIKCLRAW
jgi:hypothetical protein